MYKEIIDGLKSLFENEPMAVAISRRDVPHDLVRILNNINETLRELKNGKIYNIIEDMHGMNIIGIETKDLKDKIVTERIMYHNKPVLVIIKSDDFLNTTDINGIAVAIHNTIGMAIGVHILDSMKLCPDESYGTIVNMYTERILTIKLLQNVIGNLHSSEIKDYLLQVFPNNIPQYTDFIFKNTIEDLMDYGMIMAFEKELHKSVDLGGKDE